MKNNMALDIMPYLKEDKEFAANISRTNLNYWTTDKGQLFTVADVLSLSGGYWYNKDILDAAGAESPPKSWDAFPWHVLQNTKMHQRAGENEVKPLP